MSARHVFAAAAWLFLAACGGCDDPPPPDDTFDGNIVVGDALPPPDGQLLDAELGEDAAGDDGAIDEDAEPGDRGDSGELADADVGVEDAGVDCFPEPAFSITASVAVAGAAALDDVFLEITGTATISALVCSSCADVGTCTCTCTATAAIDGLVALVQSPCFSSPGCSGNECTQVCRPPVLGVEQRFRGRLDVRNSGPEKSVVLELYSVSP